MTSENTTPTSRGFRGAGGTEGGVRLFAVGLGLTLISLWLFLDSVQVTTAGMGWISGTFGMGLTTSSGIVFVPFFLGVCALFYDAKQDWAWWLTLSGLGVIVIEIVSRIQFLMTMKTSHFLLMVLLFGAGTGLMLRSYRPASK
jgi:uncharacterized protein